MENTYKTALKLNVRVNRLTPNEARRHFPYIHFVDTCDMVYEQSEAGYINPRRLVLAEQVLAQKQVSDDTGSPTGCSS